MSVSLRPEFPADPPLFAAWSGATPAAIRAMRERVHTTLALHASCVLAAFAELDENTPIGLGKCDTDNLKFHLEMALEEIDALCASAVNRLVEGL